MTADMAMPGLDATRLDLAREFRADPFGRHSADLQALLTIFRREPIEGRYALFARVPGREWVLVRLSGVRGKPPVFLMDQVFHSLEDAEWTVFKLRWEVSVRSRGDWW